MIHEYRKYRIKMGKMPEYLDLFDKVGLEILARHLHLLGFWSVDSGELGWVHHLWAHESPNDRAARFASLRADPDWTTKFLPVAVPMVEECISTLLTPVPFSGKLLLGNEPSWTPLAS